MKVYQGRLRGPSWDDAVVEVYETETLVTAGPTVHQSLRRIGPLRHHVKHSPSGFSWGYAGAGPSELARCILLDHLGDQVKCRECHGAGTIQAVVADLHGPPDGEVVAEPTVAMCSACWGEGTTLAPAVYQAFKFDRVAKWPTDADWQITEQQINEWLAMHLARQAGA